MEATLQPPSELGVELQINTAADEVRLRQLLELEPSDQATLADPPPAPYEPPARDATAYAASEVKRLQELEARLEAQLQQTRLEIMAVRGGINAYLDVIAYLRKEGPDGLDNPGHLG